MVKIYNHSKYIELEHTIEEINKRVYKRKTKINFKESKIEREKTTTKDNRTRRLVLVVLYTKKKEKKMKYKRNEMKRKINTKR